MKTYIIAAGHKTVDNRAIINLFCDEFKWDTLKEKATEMRVHINGIKKLIIENNKLKFHSESLTFIDCDGV